jgi:hypothetical protein
MTCLDLLSYSTSRKITERLPRVILINVTQITFDEVYSSLNSVAHAPPWDPSTPAQLLADMLQDSCVPNNRECVAVSVAKPKTAALVYDRVWGLAGDVPEEIRIGGVSQSEVLLAAQQVIRWRATGRHKIRNERVSAFFHALDR